MKGSGFGDGMGGLDDGKMIEWDFLKRMGGKEIGGVYFMGEVVDVDVEEFGNVVEVDMF